MVCKAQVLSAGIYPHLISRRFLKGGVLRLRLFLKLFSFHVGCSRCFPTVPNPSPLHGCMQRFFAEGIFGHCLECFLQDRQEVSWLPTSTRVQTPTSRILEPTFFPPPCPLVTAHRRQHSDTCKCKLDTCVIPARKGARTATCVAFSLCYLKCQLQLYEVTEVFIGPQPETVY